MGGQGRSPRCWTREPGVCSDCQACPAPQQWAVSAAWCLLNPLPCLSSQGAPPLLCPTPRSSGRGDRVPLSPQDFLRCVTAALIYFAISITAVAKYSDGASKAAGVSNCPTPGRGWPVMPPSSSPYPSSRPRCFSAHTLSVWGLFSPCFGPQL